MDMVVNFFRNTFIKKPTSFHSVQFFTSIVLLLR